METEEMGRVLSHRLGGAMTTENERWEGPGTAGVVTAPGLLGPLPCPESFLALWLSRPNLSASCGFCGRPRSF